MTEQEIKIGDLVWAKMKGWSPWPGKVCSPTPELMKSKSKTTNKNQYCIWFFGTNNYAWIEEHSIKDYEQYKDRLSKTCKNAAFKEACTAIEDYITRKAAGIDVDAELFPDPVPGAEVPEPINQEESVELDGTVDEVNKDENDVDEAAVVDEQTSAATTPQSKKRKNADDSTSESPEKLSAPSQKKKKTSVRNGESFTKKRKALPTTPVDATTSFVKYPNHAPRRSAADMFLDRPSSFKPAREEAPLNVSSVSQYLKDKKVVPSKLKFGFLGLGIMGRGIVKNLLNSGHKVIVWNRTPDKCKDFIEAGAEQGMTPSDVVSSADITFSCVADPQASKDMVFGNCGVLQEIDTRKAYVEMTGIDAETSKDIEEAISIKGGRYLEAQLQGSKQESEDGQLVILCSGDRSLYDDCLTAFSAMGKTSFFLNSNAGSSTKMNLVLQLIAGVMVSGLAEGMALADRVGLEMKDVMDVLQLTSMSCPFINEKGSFMVDSQFPTRMPLQHMQKDLNLALGMGNSFEQPLPMAATANEVFKHARRLGYSEHDCAALYIRARF
ncbi:unnamed protein product [Orchesella dallaii]|uniref:Cytokine-like nuclear factor N-PAC n=1 Tax=Orchesella dallaii TaxID=48710 RepID=A0ABP1PZ19_9HEXA